MERHLIWLMHLFLRASIPLLLATYYSRYVLENHYQNYVFLLSVLIFSAFALIVPSGFFVKRPELIRYGVYLAALIGAVIAGFLFIDTLLQIETLNPKQYRDDTHRFGMDLIYISISVIAALLTPINVRWPLPAWLQIAGQRVLLGIGTVTLLMLTSMFGFLITDDQKETRESEYSRLYDIRAELVEEAESYRAPASFREQIEQSCALDLEAIQQFKREKQRVSFLRPAGDSEISDL